MTTLKGAAPDPTTVGFERAELPSGIVVWYRDSDHSYWEDVKLNGARGWSGKGRLTGVSTIAKAMDFNPDGLMKWASDLQCDGVALLAQSALELQDIDDMRAALRWLASGDLVREALFEHELTWQHLRDKRATEGTNVHKHSLHALATGEAIPRFDDMTEEEKGFSRGVMGFWHEHEPEADLAEQMVAIPEHGVAGRLDLVYRRDDGLCTMRRLLDAKTCKLVPRKKDRPFYPARDQVQVAGYDMGLEASGFGKTDVQEILYVDADGDYEVVTSHATHDSFLKALATYREAPRCQREAGAMQKAENQRLQAVAA